MRFNGNFLEPDIRTPYPQREIARWRNDFTPTNQMITHFTVGGGTTAYEAMLERKRAALRRALKSEYIKKMYNPKSYNKEGYIEMHDAAILRYHAMQKTVPEYWFPNIRSFGFFCALVVLPIGVHHYFHNNDRKDFEKKCRSGEYAYDDPARSGKWWSTI